MKKIILEVVAIFGLFVSVSSSCALKPQTTNNLNDHEWVDLCLSVKWATCNVGANTPNEYGSYFAWGETKEKDIYNMQNSKTYGDVNMINDIGGNPQYDAATANWGKGWRLPSKNELQELSDNCIWEWIVQEGHNGYRVTGPNGNSIFFPAAGSRNGSNLNLVGKDGFCWSSSPFESDSCGAYFFDFYIGGRLVDWGDRYFGRSVRPVCD